MKNTVFLITLISLPCLANSYVQACFGHEKLAISVAREIEFLKVPADKFQLNKDCLNISTDPLRVDLYKKYLRTNYDVKLYDSEEPTSKKECHITLRKVSNIKSQSNNTGVANNQAVLNQNNQTSTTEQSSQLILMEGLPGFFRYQDLSYQLKCFKNGEGFDIEITSASDKVSFHTKRFVKANEEVELGSILEKTEGANNKANINSGIVYTQKETQKNTLVFLRVSE